MKVVSLLIVWWIPLLHTAGTAQSLSRDSIESKAETGVKSVVMPQAWDVVFPGHASEENLGASLEDEDDSLEDDLFDAGLSLRSSWQNLDCCDISSVARPQRNLPSNPSDPHPLRC